MIPEGNPTFLKRTLATLLIICCRFKAQASHNVCQPPTPHDPPSKTSADLTHSQKKPCGPWAAGRKFLSLKFPLVLLHSNGSVTPTINFLPCFRFSNSTTFMWRALRAQRHQSPDTKKLNTLSICACHPCAGAMLIFSVSFQFLRMLPRRCRRRCREAVSGR